MKAKIWIIAIFFAGVIFVSGCVNSNAETSVETTTTAEGIEASFAPGAPPETISEGDQFDISVLLENKGEYTTPKNLISVSLLGVNPASFTSVKSLSSTQTINSESLQGSSVLNGEKIPGAEEFVEWNNVKYNVPISSDQNLNFVAQVSYIYQTIASLEGCFNSNPYVQTTGAETCKVSGEKDFYNTGAPVRVNKVEESPAGNNKFTFVFNIKNEGAGTVFSRDKFSSATDLEIQDLNKVEVLGVFIGGVQNTCNGALPIGTTKTIRLGDDGGRFICTVNIGTGTESYDYKEVIQVILSYGYNEQVRRTVTVRNIIGDGLTIGTGTSGSKDSKEDETVDNSAGTGADSTGTGTSGAQAAVCIDDDDNSITTGGVVKYIPLGGNSFTEYKDSCDGITLTEWTCDGNSPKSEQISCVNLGYKGCSISDGKGYCSGSICYDSDGANNIGEKGYVIISGEKYIDKCGSETYTDPATGHTFKTKAVDYYCDGFNLGKYNGVCATESGVTMACDDGACVKCYDTDGGKNGNIKGAVVDYVTNIWSVDKCVDNNQNVGEYYCTPDNRSGLYTVLCKNGCSDGACLPA